MAKLIGSDKKNQPSQPAQAQVSIGNEPPPFRIEDLHLEDLNIDEIMAGEPEKTEEEALESIMMGMMGLKTPGAQPSEAAPPKPKPTLNPKARTTAELVLGYIFKRVKKERTEACHLLGAECDWSDKLSLALKEPAPIKGTLAQIKRWAKDRNVFVRIELARRGLAPEILKYDSSSTVRLLTLQNTGEFSEHYREREADLHVIQEMIKQDIDRDYWRELSPQLATFVEQVEQSESLIERIELGDVRDYKQTIQLLISLSELEEYQDRQDILREAIQYLKAIYENDRADMRTQSMKEFYAQKDREYFVLLGAQFLTDYPDTPFGQVIHINRHKGMVTVNALDNSGEETKLKMDIMEMEEFITNRMRQLKKEQDYHVPNVAEGTEPEFLRLHGIVPRENERIAGQ